MIDWIRKNVWTVLAVAASIALAGGCAFFPPKGPSPTDPTKFVTRPQLEAEVIAFEAKTRASLAAIEAQEMFLQTAMQQLSAVITAVPGPWSGLGVVALGLVTAGLGVDNRRKDGVIQGQKTILKRIDPQAEPPKEG